MEYRRIIPIIPLTLTVPLGLLSIGIAHTDRPEEPIYKLAPTTDRDAELLAKRHRFDSLASLTQFLARGANVLDVGAGLSNFGVTVAASRPDIHWTNFDYSYNDPSILDRAQADAPENMSFVAGDAIILSQLYQDEQFDAVFSYWMFPHLSIGSELPAEDAARQIYRVAKQGALICIGPNTDKRPFPLFHEKKSIHVYKDEAGEEGGFAEKLVRATKLGPLMRYVTRIDNIVGTATVGTTAGIQKGRIIPRIYDQRSDTYVSPFSDRGARVVGKVALAISRYIAQNPPHWRSRNEKVSIPVIRQARPEDLDRLVELEFETFDDVYEENPTNPRKVRAMIDSRLSVAPELTFVGEINGVIEGAMSSQRTDKEASKITSWEETTNNGTLVGTHISTGKYLYVVNLASTKTGTEHRLFDQLTAMTLGTFIGEQFEEAQLLSRIPGFSQWLDDKHVDFEKLTPTEQDELAEKYVHLTRIVKGKEQPYDGVLRRYIDFGVKPVAVLRDSYLDPSSKNYEVLCTYKNPLPRTCKGSRTISRIVGRAIQYSANHPALLSRLP